MKTSAALVQRAQEGDFAAFEAIYDLHNAMVYAIALRIANDRMIAEDVTQDVFVKFWQEPSAFRGGYFAGWLARVTRNRTIDVLRSRRMRPEFEIPTTLHFESGVEDDLFAQLDAEQLRKALGELPEEQRSLIELAFFSNVTHEGLAAATGLPLGTIKWRIRAGLRKMRESLSDRVTA
jgi:RNA polymerase sigma-70 factor (ECF subfamily)